MGASGRHSSSPVTPAGSSDGLGVFSVTASSPGWLCNALGALTLVAGWWPCIEYVSTVRYVSTTIGSSIIKDTHLSGWETS